MSCSCNKTVPETGEIAKLKVELAAMTALKNHLQDALDCIELAVGFDPVNEPLASWVQAKMQELEAAQKACASLRNYVSNLADIAQNNDISETEWNAIEQLKDNALSTDCGKNWHSPAEWDALQAKCAEMHLSFAALRETNVRRCEAVFHKLAEWSPTDWACALAGEAGETCNAVKKLRRMNHGTNTAKDPKTYEGHVEAIAKEIADTVIYADLLAARLGIRLDDAIREKFNEVSDRMNCQIKLSTDCGKDYVSKEQVKPMVEALRFIRCECDWETGDGRIMVACDKALAHAKEMGL